MPQIRFFLIACTCSLLQTAFTQPSNAWQQSIDVQYYRLAFTLSDNSDRVEGWARIGIRFPEARSSFRLDLVGPQPDGRGMRVRQVTENGQALSFLQQGNALLIQLPDGPRDSIREFSIRYGGIPADGLIISTNKYGDRTFFGDNWPDRAHHWYPCIDHPSDKARFSFDLSVPEGYQAIANGRLAEETDLPNGKKRFVYETSVPIPTKVAVIGVAAFAVGHLPDTNAVPISSWVYPQNRAAGFYDYAIAGLPLRFFSDWVGPYPFAKLANVQSTTRFGGMENAGNIFYAEGSVDSTRRAEGLIAHEIAHQWFGNSASESDWPHLWLSEGFATYFSALYLEHRYGPDTLRQLMRSYRDRVLGFHRRVQRPVVDTAYTSLMSLLNANSYQKGAWVLHMLRRRLGDDTFRAVVRTYYDRYRLGNASTGEFVRVAEEVSGQELESFFRQWLYRSGHPVLEIAWKDKGTALQIDVRQLQAGAPAFQFPLEIVVYFKDGSERREQLSIRSRSEIFTLEKTRLEMVDLIEIDPSVALLFETSD